MSGIPDASANPLDGLEDTTEGNRDKILLDLSEKRIKAAMIELIMFSRFNERN